MVRVARLLLLALVACSGTHTPETIENRVGDRSGIQCLRARGMIRERETNEPALGATIVISGALGTQEDVAITDEHGKFDMTLHPDRTTITVYYADQTHTQPFDRCEGIQLVIATTGRRNSNLP